MDIPDIFSGDEVMRMKDVWMDGGDEQDETTAWKALCEIWNPNKSVIGASGGIGRGGGHDGKMNLVSGGGWQMRERITWGNSALRQ